MNQVTDTALSFEPAYVVIEDVIVKDRLRKLNDKHVKAIMESFESLGGEALLQPIVLSPDLVLADGAHRLEAAKRSGWTHIAAWVASTPITDWDIQTIEAEANMVRRQFTPVELHDIWVSIESQVRSETKQSQAIGHQNLKIGDNSPVIENYYNRENGQTSVANLVQRVLGTSVDQMEMVGQIKNAAENEEYPKEIRLAAKKGIDKLSDPEAKAKVTTIFNTLLSLKDEADKQTMSREELEEDAARKKIDQLLDRSTLLASNLVGNFGEDIRYALSLNSVFRDDVQGSTSALVEATAKTVTLLALSSDQPSYALQELATTVHIKLKEHINKFMMEAESDAS